MTDDEARFLLEDMRDYAREAVQFLGGKTDAEVQDDRILSRALAYIVQVVGEAAFKAPEGRRDAHPQIPWSNAASLRHRIVHGYRIVLLPVVLSTIRNDFPPLIADIDRILAEGA
jgi:uncharacterized protein with HEPN domain